MLKGPYDKNIIYYIIIVFCEGILCWRFFSTLRLLRTSEWAGDSEKAMVFFCAYPIRTFTHEK